MPGYHCARFGCCQDRLPTHQREDGGHGLASASALGSVEADEVDDPRLVSSSSLGVSQNFEHTEVEIKATVSHREPD